MSNPDRVRCRQREMELGNLAEEREAEENEEKDDNSGDEDGGGGGGDSKSNTRHVARTFRYMRKRPTIIFYKPPEGD